MNLSHLALMGVFVSRYSRSLRSNRPEGGPGLSWAQLLAVLFGWRRAQSPPVQQLSNHLRRDIGLEPILERRAWLWHR